MKRIFFGALLAAGLATQAAAQDIAPDHITLSTSGLAHISHSAKVDGKGRLRLPVRLEQVDDILKSLVVLDASGRVGGVTLPGRQPLSEIFRDLPFTPQALDNPMMMLNAYRGAGVTVKTAKGAISGKIVAVAPEQTVSGENSETRHRLSLMTAAGLQQAVIENIESLRFDDAGAQRDMTRALDALRDNAAAGQRVLTIDLPGAGARDIGLSYVVAAPVWKSSYRMVLPAAGGKDGLLQGWAVVENMTATDWKNVRLSLVSGNPVTFRQALYTSYYVDRPEVPVEVSGRILPRVDRGAVADAAMMESAPRLQKAMRAAPAPAPAMAADMMMAESAVAMTGAGFMGMNQLAAQAQAAVAADQATQVSFHFPDRISLAAGQSMMLPFVSRRAPMTRLSLYQPDTHATHPLAAVEVENSGDSGLPAGVLTLYEDDAHGGSYVGDAQMPALPAGEKRLLSYALDTRTKIDRNDKSAETEGRIAIDNGVLRTAVTTRLETVYTLRAPAKEGRTVVIEHPRTGDFTLAAPAAKDVETTDSHYRLRVGLKAGETKAVTVVLAREDWRSYALSDMDADTLLAYAGGRGGLGAAAKKSFAALAEARRDIAAADRALQAIEKKRQTIFDDQARVRQNLDSLKERSDIQKRYLQKLSEQEDQLATLAAEAEKQTDIRARHQARLAKLVAELKI